jgi:hypothetical protein
MFQSDDIEVWNLNPNVTALTGSQRIFNVVGKLKDPERTKNLFYSLNGGPEHKVFFNRSRKDSERLENVGDFNIDSIKSDTLKSINLLTFRVVQANNQEKICQIEFPTQKFSETEPIYTLDLRNVNYPQQVGQIVDGKWQVDKNQFGEPCLEIKELDAGYDRIILFGRHDWTTGYEVITRLCVKKWTGIREHGLGIGFKWNPHLQGNGDCLPLQWNTGLGLYYFPKTLSLKPGVRISLSVDVHFDTDSNYVGETILSQGVFSFWRWAYGTLKAHVFRMKYPPGQITIGKHHWVKLLVQPSRYEFTVWKSGEKEPLPQVIASDPNEQLIQGSVAIIAHHCALRVYELIIKPIS